MTNEEMKVIFQKDNTLKKNVIGALRQCDIKLGEAYIDFILLEIPDNSADEGYLGLQDREILVKVSKGVDTRLIAESLECICSGIGTEKVCDEMIEHMKEMMDAEIVAVKGKVKNGRGGMTRNYYMQLVVMLHQGLFGYVNLFKYILSELLENTKQTGDLDKIDNEGEKYKHYFGRMQERWMLMRSYAEYFLKSRDLPEAEVLTKLSAERYEGSESEARIYFSDKGIRTVERFGEIGRGTRRIMEDNTRMIRKLMEICKRNTVYLYAEKDQSGKYVITRLVEEIDRKNSCDTYIKFSGFLQWSVMCGQREELAFHHGKYDLNSSQGNKSYEEAVRNLTGVDQDMVKELVEILQKQKHGTGVIISDCSGDIENEVNRLCKLNRGIRITSEICYHKEKEENERWDRGQLLSITGIDGVLFMDLTGRCLAIGLIVDGKATIEGNVGRGARYNAIANYVLQQKSGIYIGIIISEDGIIDVLQNTDEQKGS